MRRRMNMKRRRGGEGWQRAWGGLQAFLSHLFCTAPLQDNEEEDEDTEEDDGVEDEEKYDEEYLSVFHTWILI